MNIPDDLSLELSAKFHNLGQAALEALAAEAYEREVLSLEQVRRMLDLPSRWEAQALLSRHGVWPGTSREDFHADTDALAGSKLSATLPLSGARGDRSTAHFACVQRG